MPIYTATANWQTLAPLTAATTFQCQGTGCRVTADAVGSPTTNLDRGIELQLGWVHTFPTGATVSYRTDNGNVKITAEPAG